MTVGWASGLPRFGILPNRFVAAGCRDGQAGRPPYPTLAAWRTTSHDRGAITPWPVVLLAGAFLPPTTSRLG